MPYEETEVGTILEENIAFENSKFKVIERIIKPRGGNVRSQFIWDRRGKVYVVILAVTENGEIIFVDEPKYGISRRILALPAGNIEDGESVWTAAKRELLEETGYVAERWKILKGPIINFPDKIDGGEHFFLVGEGAKYFSRPSELDCIPRFVKKEEVTAIIAGEHPNIEIYLAVSLACLACWWAKSTRPSWPASQYK